ncbi:hypothetical protein [Leclercia sp.]|uniref:hypothetical protein n=1 Tax=Leclercia sp. TaxID=1898428 RepID=UPI0028A051BB|nr:hypothetical protein [Leclercia sp.]
MSKTPRLTLEKTFLYEQNDACIRYEVYQNDEHPKIVALILVTREDEKGRIIVERIHPNSQAQPGSSSSQKEGAMFNTGPLQVASSGGYCAKHFDESYS